MTKIVLLIGSAPDAVRVENTVLEKVEAIVCVNNSWRIRQDWTHIVYPEDFPEDRRPSVSPQRPHITHEAFVPANNAFGGIVYAGATMAYTAGYWALDALKPDVLAFIGSDMIYDDPEKSHFYGKGEADPLRDDPTLQSLEAKSNRLLALAAQEGCACVNLSIKPYSRLTFPRCDIDALNLIDETQHEQWLAQIEEGLDHSLLKEALEVEKEAGQFFASGDYWNSRTPVDRNALAQIDALWEKVVSQQSVG